MRVGTGRRQAASLPLPGGHRAPPGLPGRTRWRTTNELPPAGALPGGSADGPLRRPFAGAAVELRRLIAQAISRKEFR